MLKKLPVLVTKKIYVFPDFAVEINVGRNDSLLTVAAAKEIFENNILLISQIDDMKELIEIKNLYQVGVLCKLEIIKKIQKGFLIKAVAQQRVKVSNFITEKQVIFGEYKILKDQKLKDKDRAEIIGLISKILGSFQKKLPETMQIENMSPKKITNFIYTIINNFPENPDNFKQKALEATSLIKKYQILKKYVNLDTSKKIDLNKLVDQSIDRRVKNRLTSQHREYVLREKMKEIQKELGEMDSQKNELSRYLKRLKNEPFPKEIRLRMEEEINRYETLPPTSGESSVVKGYIDWVMSLPWHQKTPENNDLTKTEKILNQNHFGLKKPKERIIEHLAASLFSKKIVGQIICLVGPPGVGKTSLGFSIAQSLGRNYVRIALGGIKDESEIRGHRRTYIGSMPGKIIQAMKKAKSMNPVILIDEIDKMGSDYRGDPASAMLEVLDPEQNKEFIDHYIEETYNLAQVMFIATANYEGDIPPALYDRMEIVNLSSYTEIEKISIAEKHLIPNILKNLGLSSKQLKFTKKGLEEIIKYYTREAGVREINRIITKIARKFIVKLLNKKITTERIDEKNIKEYLKKRLYEHTQKSNKVQIGVATGLAYTQFGGEILPIETTMFPGKGRLILTGKLGEVMQESANIAFDFMKANAKNFSIPFEKFRNNDVHIHVPEGAVPKDGPSAGVTLTTALISLLKKQPVSNNLGMTGEITLQGRVLQIGGLREKAISAARSGLKKIIIPKENNKDIVDIPDEVRKKLEIIEVSDYKDIYKLIFKN